MTQRMKPMAVRARLVLLLATVACSSTGGSPTADTSGSPNVAAAPAVDVTVTNATNFHMLDFVAWNNHDVDMFRRLHTADVKVEFGGVTTNGIDAHVQALEPMWKPNLLITHHVPVVAEGEWTCMVGVTAPPNAMKTVTVAKWRDGAISEEYLFGNLLRPGTAKPATTGEPTVSIANQRPELKALIGAELGWSCRMERTADGKNVVTLSKSGGTAAEQMVFTQ
ncbi:MAG TPA: nuclear transport factor 2 family protein [Gemmatimonadaceae bacterium]|nr:nuclear transport factor 2 family protein [Gemmatimonadaceae bacterium]